MSNNQNIVPYSSGNGGWGDAAAENAGRLLCGSLLKFNNEGKWGIGKEFVPLPNGFQLAALDTKAAWVFWQGGKPVDEKTVVRGPGEQLPDRDTLGDNDKGQWEKGFNNELKDPWANTRYIHFANPETAEAYTFSTTSIGGKRAVSELSDAVSRMRITHPNATPIVEFGSKPMATRYGVKPRPHFQIVGWLGLIEGEAKPAPAARRLTQQEVSEADKKSLDHDFRGDEIPWK
jgi:hypothetical protein